MALEKAPEALQCQSLTFHQSTHAVTSAAHAVVLLDQAGWHTSPKLPVPGNFTLLPLPAISPELNPTEKLRQFMRDYRLSNRVHTSDRDILDHCYFA